MSYIVNLMKYINVEKFLKVIYIVHPRFRMKVHCYCMIHYRQQIVSIFISGLQRMTEHLKAVQILFLFFSLHYLQILMMKWQLLL